MNDLMKTIKEISSNTVMSYDTTSIKNGINAARELE
jgi:hypothetical protein